MDTAAATISSDGTIQGGPKDFTVTVDPGSPSTYHFTFPRSAFVRIPAVVVMPIGNVYVAGLGIAGHTDTWTFDVTLSSPATFEFIATSESP